MFEHKTEDEKSVETFVVQYGSLSTQRYNYVDIKKMMNSFQVKLGQGGFGTVFKGKLSDGRRVAVKVLNTSKAKGQEFINEVTSIGRTSHTSENIRVGKLYEIPLGIARGLDYLHRGCNTRILHLDIKPHNILLDEEFYPKKADFGLAKLYSRKESIVSMLEARGTIGYIAPKVFNRNFGGVSHKSDVYSYGMLILEMVGGRKNVDVDVGSGHTSEIYFPHWVYSRLKKEEIVLDGVATIEENDYARKMTIVGLWCIQVNLVQRPSTNEVIEMLEGSMEELEIPSRPFFSSPPRSPITTFSTSQEATQDYCCSTNK
ncbi:hypothetical protein L6452_15364 [Arctium lappa]|uniref:Uncharacterized protein n=1 Tax=Arctium lappa TaxID=4217 RepID=A0ACB9CNJ1_ARCLA|nr:hypothetical protein L6452_15364 [Arctium lappa]